jgi:hypothetical protein
MPNLSEIRQVFSEIKYTDGKNDTASYKYYAFNFLQKKRVKCICKTALKAWPPAGGNPGAWKESKLENKLNEICQIFIAHAINWKRLNMFFYLAYSRRIGKKCLKRFETWIYKQFFWLQPLTALHTNVNTHGVAQLKLEGQRAANSCFRTFVIRTAESGHDTETFRLQCQITGGAHLVTGPVYPWYRLTTASWGSPVTESWASRDLTTPWRQFRSLCRLLFCKNLIDYLHSSQIHFEYT